MNIPEKLFYTNDHEWIDFQQDIITIGITDFAQSQLGDIIFVEMPSKGINISQGDSLGEIEAVKTVSEFYAPLSGTVVGINETIENSPDSINSNPYDKGWLIKIKYSNSAEKSSLLSSADYMTLIS